VSNGHIQWLVAGHWEPQPVILVAWENMPHSGLPTSQTIDDLVETSEIGDWKMPDFRMACAYAASQGWLVVQDDVLTLTTAGLAAA
jgi:hypothetical protein